MHENPSALARSVPRDAAAIDRIINAAWAFIASMVDHLDEGT